MSLGEWSIARRAGVPNERITLEGIGKTEADLQAAAEASVAGDPLRWIAIESVEHPGKLSLRDQDLAWLGALVA